MRRWAAIGIAIAAVVVPATAAAFVNPEPLAARQWYLDSDRAWSFWPTQPQLFPISVAVIDSGIDGTHPEFTGRVVAAKSFVGGSPYRDDQGHGTFVAGEIAANPFNGQGIAGMAFNARLMIAKVVEPDGSVSLKAEVAAIRWAVDNGARVINLSLGGVRDPLDPSLDTYSPLEQAAVEYAYSKGVVVVAAVGNGPQSPATPWGYAHYPASLPHVIGVSAVRQDGSVPDYSNRDAVYNDLAAPGDGIFSTIPTNLVEAKLGCADMPYSNCGPFEFQDAIGTSFAAPQVSAAAALLLGQDPMLRPEQVAWLLERTADDANAATGCSMCPVGRDRFTGWGTLDVESALDRLTKGSLPPVDHYEPNDNAGPWAHALPPLPRTIEATLDYWDDDLDVYRDLSPEGAAAVRTGHAQGHRRRCDERVGARHAAGRRSRRQAPARRAVAVRRGAGARRVSATQTGRYYLELKIAHPTRDPLVYRLAVARG